MVKKQTNAAVSKNKNAINGDRHLKNNGCTHTVNTKERDINKTIFNASRLLYFSHPNKMPPITKPTNKKESPHKKYINPIEIALLGKR